MTLGEKIILLRKEKGMSQEKLAELLSVSRQAVYKWEVNESTPDMDKLGKLTNIFGVSYDFLLNDSIDYVKEGVDAKEIIQEEIALEKKEEQTPNEVVTPEVIQKTSLAKCEKCGKDIYEHDDLIKHEAVFRTFHGKNEMVSPAYYTCKKCEDKMTLEDLLKQQKDLKKRKNKALGWGIAIDVIVVAILAIATAMNPDYMVPLLVTTIVVGLLLFPAIFTIIIDNTFAGEMWIEVASWGFVRMPGIIFSLDLGGIAFLIVVKILLWLLGIALVVLAIVFATVLAIIVSPITFPLSIVRYMKQRDLLQRRINSIKI